MNQKLFNEDYLKHLCKQYGLVPSKKYGQNFLINPEVVEKMVEAAEIKKDDMVIEVGPGFGVLTFALAEYAKKVLSFEIEKKLEPYWQEQVDQHKNIEVVWGNILYEFKGDGLKAGEYKVVANLPYQITSHVIRKFLEMENNPDILVLMVQKEVAERICAPAGEMSVLAVSVQYYGEPEIVTLVPRSDFWPAPAVDSAVIRIKIKNLNCHSERSEESLSQSTNGQRSFAKAQDDKCVDPVSFFKIVKAGFVSRRKMLIKNLSAIADKNNLRAIFQELGIDEKVRAQELSVEQWQQIVAKLSP
ncbi:MAG: ribosomal RNA small subunit methyltransferase A [Candidatus Magasanikbacteria bacterium]|nr:ribosomal RNA small subunit methyltransferase A [Candidatus Magasanikbacteria bacterium]